MDDKTLNKAIELKESIGKLEQTLIKFEEDMENRKKYVTVSNNKSTLSYFQINGNEIKIPLIGDDKDLFEIRKVIIEKLSKKLHDLRIEFDNL